MACDRAHSRERRGDGGATVAQLDEQRPGHPYVAVSEPPDGSWPDRQQFGVRDRRGRGRHDEGLGVERQGSHQGSVTAVAHGQRAAVGRARVHPNEARQHQLDVTLILARAVQRPTRWRAYRCDSVSRSVRSSSGRSRSCDAATAARSRSSTAKRYAGAADRTRRDRCSTLSPISPRHPRTRRRTPGRRPHTPHDPRGRSRWLVRQYEFVALEVRSASSPVGLPYGSIAVRRRPSVWLLNRLLRRTEANAPRAPKAVACCRQFAIRQHRAQSGRELPIRDRRGCGRLGQTAQRPTSHNPTGFHAAVGIVRQPASTTRLLANASSSRR